MNTNLYTLYTAARAEIQSDHESLVAQRYVDKLEERIAELDGQLDTALHMEAPASSTYTPLDADRVQSFLDTLRNGSLPVRLQTIRLLRTAFKMTYSEAKDAYVAYEQDHAFDHHAWAAAAKPDSDLPF